jgi:hypothetical protein
MKTAGASAIRKDHKQHMLGCDESEDRVEAGLKGVAIQKRPPGAPQRPRIREENKPAK